MAFPLQLIKHISGACEMKKPEIYDYLDYREYLKDFYSYNKSINARFSYRTFAEIAKLNTRSYLKMVIDGKRNLTHKLMFKVAEACELHGNEAKYFYTLIDYNHEKDLRQQTVYFKELHSLSRKVIKREIIGDQNRLLSKWYYTVVRTLVNLVNFKPDSACITKKMRGFISPEEAEEALDVLMDLGLLKEEDGKFSIVGKHLTGDEKTLSDYVKNYHKQMFSFSSK